MIGKTSTGDPGNGKSVAVHLPNGHECAFLLDRATEQRDEPFDAARFGSLLTDYDRILLRFGMHISW